MNRVRLVLLSNCAHEDMRLYIYVLPLLFWFREKMPCVCTWTRGVLSIRKSRAGEVGESSSHTEHGQSVYLALCSVGTPSSRLFHGPPYLSLALLLLPPPPPVRMLSLGSLQAQNHTYITSYTWMSTPQSGRRLLTPVLSYRIKTIAVSDSG